MNGEIPDIQQMALDVDDLQLAAKQLRTDLNDLKAEIHASTLEASKARLHIADALREQFNRRITEEHIRTDELLKHTVAGLDEKFRAILAARDQAREN